MKKTFLFLIVFGFTFAFCQAQVTYTQTDWSGGPDQTTFVDFTKFNGVSNVEYSLVPGEISLIDNSNNSFYGIAEYQDKIIIGSSAGIFIYNPLDNSWEHSFTGNIILYHTTIHEDLLFTLYGNNIYNYDGTKNDYGLGPNGWKHFSDITSLGITSTFTIESIDGDLLIGARRNYTGCALKWNSTLEEWEDLGGSLDNGAISFANYNGVLYVGTHWSGNIYKLDGSSWVLAYNSPLMTVNDLVIKDNVLYAGGYHTQSNSGNIYSFDGTNWTDIYSGYGIRNIIVNGVNLVFSAQRSTDSDANNLSGQIYTYDGSTSNLIYTFPSESYAFKLLANNGDLYYGGLGYSTFGGVATSDFLKNGVVLEKIYGGYVSSSDIINTDDGWGLIEYDITDFDRSGVFVTLREKRADDTYSLLAHFPHNSTISLTEDNIQYIAYFWGLKDAVLPSMQEISLHTKINVGYSEIENASQFNIYPNPSNGKVNIQLYESNTMESTISIYNYLGKIVYTRQVNNIDFISFDLSNYAKGIYLVELRNKKQRTIQKLEIY